MHYIYIYIYMCVCFQNGVSAILKLACLLKCTTARQSELTRAYSQKQWNSSHLRSSQLGSGWLFKWRFARRADTTGWYQLDTKLVPAHTKLVPSWYQLVPSWYQAGTNWYQAGTSKDQAGTSWYQAGTSLVPSWYLLVPTGIRLVSPCTSPVLRTQRTPRFSYAEFASSDFTYSMKCSQFAATF